MSIKDALIQTALDKGWSCFLASGCDKIDNLTKQEYNYLLKSATSYAIVDPSFRAIVEKHNKESNK